MAFLGDDRLIPLIPVILPNSKLQETRPLVALSDEAIEHEDMCKHIIGENGSSPHMQLRSKALVRTATPNTSNSCVPNR